MCLSNLFKRTAFLGLFFSLLFAIAINAQMGGGMGNHGNMGKSMGKVMLISGSKAYRPDGKRLEMNDAVDISRQYLSNLKISGLEMDEIEEWEYNFYVVVKETTPPQHKAFQLVIDKWNGSIMPEPGPNMMWNQKYGSMGSGMAGGMMGGGMGGGNMNITPESAATFATQFLQERFAPSLMLIVSTSPDIFYGYYNFDVNDSASGKKYGMLSVNGATGQVWYHSWHGNFITGKEL